MIYIEYLLDFYELLKKWIGINNGWPNQMFACQKMEGAQALDLYLMLKNPYILNYGENLQNINQCGLISYEINIARRMNLK